MSSISLRRKKTYEFEDLVTLVKNKARKEFLFVFFAFLDGERRRNGLVGLVFDETDPLMFL